MTAFVKSMDHTGSGFLYLSEKFPQRSEAKLTADIFVGPQIREVMKDEEFTSKLATVELEAWNTFKDVVNNFLGNFKSDSYKSLVKNMVGKFRALGCRISIKLHLLDSHVNTVKSRVKGSIRTFVQWTVDTKVDGIGILLLTIAGH